MIKKKAKLHLDERQNTIIENAFFYCNPPELSRNKKKERPPVHEYVRAMVHPLHLAEISVSSLLRSRSFYTSATLLLNNLSTALPRALCQNARQYPQALSPSSLG